MPLAAALAVSACQGAGPIDAAPASGPAAPVAASVPSAARGTAPAAAPEALPAAPPAAGSVSAGPVLAGPVPASVAPAAADPDDFALRPQVRDFVQDMAQRHGFAPDALEALFARTRRSPEVLRLIAPAAPTFKRSWSAYRARFLDALRIREGLRFWGEHAEALARAAERFGVPEEIVVAIIGVETIYGRNTGSFRVVDALATLAFDYPRRADYFRGELEQYLLYAREAGIDPLSVRGSFAGAIGLPQFMPRSLRSFATDFDGDGRIDLRASPVDAIGSVARFLSMHGWQPGGRTHYPVRLEPDAALAPLVDAGLQPRLTLAQMRPYGVQAVPGAAPPPDEKLALVDLPDGDAPTAYRLGANNFYTVTRYNRSSFYAMAVIELAEALRAARAR